MLTVRDLMNRAPVALTPEDTLRFAAEVLTSARIGGAPVVDGRRIVGMISVADIVAFEAELPPSPVAAEDERDPWASEAGRERAARDEEAGDSVWFADRWENRRDHEVEDDCPPCDPLSDHVVAEAMSRRVLTIAPGASARDAAALLAHQHAYRLLVLDGDALVGILTTSDLASALAGRIRAQAPARA